MTHFTYDDGTRHVETDPPADTILPDTMAGLLFTAVSDARSLDRLQYLPACDIWHAIHNEDFCLVCLAGSVMAGALELPTHLDLAPSMFSDPATNKLQAINLMRIGDWCCAFHKIHGYSPQHGIRARLNELGIPPFSDFQGWDQFDLHLEGLEALIPQLRSIEKDAQSIETLHATPH